MFGKKTILLVEDDYFVSDIYKTKLTRDGYEVRTAENGLRAQEELEKDVPDLVLLDIMMPYVDGLDVLKKMKEREEWKKIPIILLSNLSEKEKVETAIRLGADDYLIKSHFTPSEVVAKVKILLGE